MAMMGFHYKGGGEAVDSSASGCCLLCIASGEREIVGTMEVPMSVRGMRWRKEMERGVGQPGAQEGRWRSLG